MFFLGAKYLFEGQLSLPTCFPFFLNLSQIRLSHWPITWLITLRFVTRLVFLNQTEDSIYGDQEIYGFYRTSTYSENFLKKYLTVICLAKVYAWRPQKFHSYKIYFVLKNNHNTKKLTCFSSFQLTVSKCWA